MTRTGLLRNVLVMVLVALAATVEAQRRNLVLVPDTTLPGKWTRPIPIGTARDGEREARKFLNFLFSNGYLEASIDSCVTDSLTTTCPLHVGQRYRWAMLSGSGVAPEIASEARFREKLYADRPISPEQVTRLLEDLVVRCENNGHPFAKAWLDDLRQDANGLYATVKLDMGRAVTIDSVVVKGTARTNMRYLQSHIGIRPGDLYNESMVLALERRIRELPFVTQKQRPYVQFGQGQTKLYLFLDAKKASSINGILGVQPDPNTGKVTITGDLDLRLRNALKRGEAINLNWRKLQDQTQDLRLGFAIPNVFSSPFGIDLSLKLFRRDTTFLEVAARAGLDYLMSRGDKLSLFVNSRSSNRLGNLTTAPVGLADVDLLSYGLGLTRERFDYRFNPRSGHFIAMEGSAGRKRTSTAIATEAEQAPTIATVQYELDGQAVLHLPIKRRSTIRLAAQGGWMVNNDLYRNELYRIGGLKTLRGVDEASIFCSSYAIGTLEYRFIYEENANFFVFVDQGWWEDAAQATLVTDAPLGFGAGTTFETKAGLFSLTYALGRQFDNPVLLRGGKIHFGFTSLF
ncbi:MAG: BamA/TamA family outer membrane protein [Flavobacteriales bacterium]